MNGIAMYICLNKNGNKMTYKGKKIKLVPSNQNIVVTIDNVTIVSTKTVKIKKVK